jgi:hypothetical protein
MVFSNFQPFPFIITPLPNSTPFTYRDGTTFLEQIEKMRVWLNETLVEEFNASIDNAIAEFQAGIGNAETYVDDAIQYINNKTGDVEVQRVTLTGPYTLVIDPLWPDNHPVNMALTQDTIGGRVVTLDATIIGPLTLASAANAVTEFQLMPVGDGTWKVFQFSKVLSDLNALITTNTAGITGLTATMSGHTTTLSTHTGTLAGHTTDIADLVSDVAGLTTDVDTLTLNAGVLTAPNASRYRLGITNGGSLTITAL